MNENKGLAGEILSNDTHFAELKKFEENLESQRALQYEFYRDLQKKLHQAGIEPEVYAKYRSEKDKAFFKHMFAVNSHRCNVHLLKDFEDIRYLSSSEWPPSLKSVLEENDAISDDYIRNIALFMDDQARLSRSISDLEAAKQMQEKQMGSLMIYKVAKFLSNPLSSGSKKTIAEINAEIAKIDEQMATLRSNFDKQWHHVFNDYSQINHEKLDELRKRNNLSQTLRSKLNRMEAAIAEVTNQSLRDDYAQFKQNSSQYNLMKFCEKVIKYDYDMHLKNGDHPLTEVIPTLGDLYPTLRKDLNKLEVTLQINLKNSKKLKTLFKEMDKKNNDILTELEKSKASIATLKIKIEKLLDTSASDLSFLVVGQSESDELIKHFKNERQAIRNLKLAYVNRQALIDKLNIFLNHKTGGNLYALYRYAQQDRENNQERNTVAGCLETSYPRAIRQLLDFDQQKVVRIQSRADLVVQYHPELQTRQAEKSNAKPKERELAESLNEFITRQQNWKELSALENAMNNYPEYYQTPLYKNLIDSIMDLCVVPTPLPQYYLPIIVSSPAIQSNQPGKTARDVDDAKSPMSAGKTAEEPLLLSTDYTAFMACTAEINKEKMKPTENQNLGHLYHQRYALFEHYMNEELDARGRQRARHHIIVRLAKQQAEPIIKLCQKLDDNNPIKWRLFDFFIAPTWYHLDVIQQIIAHHPDAYKDEKLEAILSAMMTMLMQSVESARSNAINNHLGNQGHFARRAIQQQNQALQNLIHTHSRKENISNDAQWKAIETIGERLKDILLLSMQQPASLDYVGLLKDIKTFVIRLIARQVNQAEFQAIQDSLKTLTAAANPIRIATEFLLTGAQKTQEFKPQRVEVDQETLHANIEKILRAHGTANHPDKWNTIVTLYLLLDQFNEKSQDESQKIIFTNCIHYLEVIISAIKDGFGNHAEVARIFEDLHAALDLLHPDHTYYYAVQLILKMIQETDEYDLLLNPPSSGLGA